MKKSAVKPSKPSKSAVSTGQGYQNPPVNVQAKNGGKMGTMKRTGKKK